MRRLWRQGDVLLVEVQRIPEGTSIAADGVVALGEMTGHRHRFERGIQRHVDASGNQWIEVRDAFSDLVHEEHGTIRLPRGLYRVKIQREYTPQAIRPVED